jgi:predicted CxxxxCH...CXXCH cytochrome family protein
MAHRLALLAALAAGVVFLCLYSRARAAVNGSPHDFSASGPFDTPESRTNIAPGGVCSACHIPHGVQDNVLLWPRDLSSYRTYLQNDDTPPSNTPNYILPPTIQCYDCHDYHNVGDGGIDNDPTDTDFNASHQPQNIAFGDAPGPSVAGFYENNPPDETAGNYGADPGLRPTDPPYPTDNTALLKTGGHYFKYTDPDNDTSTSSPYDIGDKLSCGDCHDPHEWSSSWQAFIRNDWPAGTVQARIGSWTGQASEWMANVPPVGMTRSDLNSRQICIACHGDADSSGPAQFNHISSRYPSTALIVRPPTGVEAHGSSSEAACVSCHTHNSIEANCNGCHSYPGMDNTNSPRQLGATHAKHVGNPTGFANSRMFECEICHFGYSTSHNQSGYSAGADWTGFNPANVNIVFDNTWNLGANYAGNPMPTTGIGGTGACNLLYCHGNRVDQSDWAGTSTASNPKWDNTVSAPCGSCHGTGSQMANANHPAHLDNVFGPMIDNSSCATGVACHTAYGLSPTASHVDNAVNFRTSAGEGTPVLLAATQICQTCHCGVRQRPRFGSGERPGEVELERQQLQAPLPDVP